MANHMTSRYGGQQGSFAESLAEFAEQAKEAIDDVFREVVIEIGTSVIRLSPVDTGRFKGNWHLSVDNIENVTFEEVDPSGHVMVACVTSPSGSPAHSISGSISPAGATMAGAW